MSGLCDRCTERSSHIVNITRLPELSSVAHLGYRMVCSPCYDDLVAEANEVEEGDEDRRAEPRVKVSLKARVEGDLPNRESFSDEMQVEEISRSGLRLHTPRQIDPGAVVKITITSRRFEATAIMRVVWREEGERQVGLKLIEPSDGWERLWQDHANR